MFYTLYFTTYIMVTRKIILLTSVFPSTWVSGIQTKLWSKLKIIWSRDIRANLYQIGIYSGVFFWPSKVCMALYSSDWFSDCLWPAKPSSSCNRPSKTKPCKNTAREVRTKHSRGQMQHLGVATGEKQMSIHPMTVKPAQQVFLCSTASSTLLCFSSKSWANHLLF